MYLTPMYYHWISYLECPVNGNESLLDWDTVQHKLPWNVVLLLGSGFALADAAEACTHPCNNFMYLLSYKSSFIEVSLFQVSGLSCWLGNRLLVVQHLPDAIKALSVSVIVASVTEVISNVATTTLFLPVLAQLVSTL